MVQVIAYQMVIKIKLFWWWLVANTRALLGVSGGGLQMVTRQSGVYGDVDRLYLYQAGSGGKWRRHTRYILLHLNQQGYNLRGNIMTDKKISELTSNGTLNGSELVELCKAVVMLKLCLVRLKLGLLTAYIRNNGINNGYCLLTLQQSTHNQTYLIQSLSTDNDGKTILRMTSASANTITIPSSLTLPISIRQAGTGTTTLVADSRRNIKRHISVYRTASN